MAQYKVNANRVDPYKDFKFRVKCDGNYVAGVSNVVALTRSSQVISHRSGGDPSTIHKMPGQVDYGAITLQRGVTHDVAFEQWANKVWYLPNSSALGEEVSLKDFRKNIIIEVYNEAGQKVLAYNVYRCWVSEFEALPELDSMGNGVAIQSITLQNEGWERDDSVKEPTEPSFTFPSS